ncbi:hypothetical protein BV25DRAFT_1808564, partial [Artomyces pyxidatus]
RQDGNVSTASLLAKAGDISGALKASKYPSQEQLTRALRLLLSSSLLDDRVGDPSEAELSSQLREIVEAVITVGLEKNGDNVVQQLLYEGSEINISTAAIRTEVFAEDSTGNRAESGKATAELPSQEELNADAAEMFNAITQLSWLLIASSAFRILLSDALLVVQEVAATAAIGVETVASQVDVGATQVEAVARATELSLEGAKEKAFEARKEIGKIGDEQQERLVELDEETHGKIKDAVLVRVQQIVVSAHGNPQQRKAFLSVLSLVRKYSHKLSTSLVHLPPSSDKSIHPELHTDPRLARVLSLFRTLLERFASGHPLSPLLHAVYQVIVDIINVPVTAESEVRNFFKDVGFWLEHSLSKADYATSRAGTTALERLGDTAERIFGSKSTSHIAKSFRAFAHELHVFADKLASDKSTHRLISAIEGLLSKISKFGHSIASRAHHTRQRWERDALIYWLPRILAVLKNIPLPRIEYKDLTVEVALDSLLLTSTSASTSLVPDHVRVQNWSELQIDTVARNSQVSIVDRVQLHIDGMRFSASGFGYFVRYKGIITYEDQGLLSVNVGDAVGQGLKMDVSLTITDPASAPAGSPPFNVEDVTLDLPGLHFKFAKSKHWILNALLVQPLAGPIVRRILTKLLQTQLRNALNDLSKSLSKVQLLATEQAAQDDEPVSVGHYWSAFLHADEEAEAEPATVSTTALSLTGAARTTTAADPSGSPGENAATLAIGIGPQVVPDDAGAYDGSPDALRVLVDSVAAAGARTGEAVEDAAERAEGVKEGTAEARRRQAVREQLERRRSGWRSDAFDL